jgi:murein DD-endopeptidase MepM/ murein hydrolase activator NlpD
MNGLVKGTLLFLAGLLLGANLVYFAMRDRAPRTATSAGVQRATDDAAAKTTKPARHPVPVPASATPGATPTTTAKPPVARPAPPRDVLLIPVQGVRPTELQDTFQDARGGGARVHVPLHIRAARATPVLSATDGRVEKLFESVQGGHTIYVFDDDASHAYYYAHLDRYAPGLKEGGQVKRGEVIGYVGSTGNASEDAPHLHFAIYELGPQKKWWEGIAIDPFPLLATPR